MNVDELYDLVEDFFGYKAKMRYINSATKEVACVLYDSFLLKCNLDRSVWKIWSGFGSRKRRCYNRIFRKKLFVK